MLISSHFGKKNIKKIKKKKEIDYRFISTLKLFCELIL